MRGVVRVGVVLVVALTAACGPSSSGSPAASPAASSSSSAGAAPLSSGPAVPPVDGIEAEAVQLRTDEAIGGQVQVRVTNTGQQPFTITSVAIDSPGFTALPARDVTATYAPRQVIDLPAPFGEPLCDTAAEPAAALLTVVRTDGAGADLRVPLSAEVLGRIHAEECAVEHVLSVVAIEVSGLHDDGDGSIGTLTLTRRDGAEPVTVTRLGRSVLIEPTADGLPLELPGDGDVATIDLFFTPASCDPHVLAETKQPYRFVIGVVLGDEDEVAMDLPLDGEDEGALAAMVQRVCR